MFIMIDKQRGNSRNFARTHLVDGAILNPRIKKSNKIKPVSRSVFISTTRNNYRTRGNRGKS